MLLSTVPLVINLAKLNAKGAKDAKKYNIACVYRASCVNFLFNHRFLVVASQLFKKVQVRI
jgi:hypothetical protein